MKFRSSYLICALLGSPLLACDANETPKASAAPAPAAVSAEAKTAPAAPANDKLAQMRAKKEAKKYYVGKCVVCHGDSGAGDGPGAEALTPKPRAFADPEWQASITDEQLAKVILGGGAATGKSPIMPANPELKGKDKELVLAELIKLVRAFKK